MNKTWFIADTHFNHVNIIKYCSRPFSSVEKMNEILIKNWNLFISNDDLVFHFGDFGFVNNYSNLIDIGNSLNGKKFLIKGNHDKNPDSIYIKAGFKKIYEFPIIFKDFFILSHWPIQLNSNYFHCNIHGHLHNNSEMSCMINDKNLYYSVSVENTSYTPVDFETIKKYYSIY